MASTCGEYEAKLLTGKRIPLSDATYLHGLEDRLLERYKKFAYPFLQLNGQHVEQTSKIEALEEKVEQQGQILAFLQRENVELRREIGQRREVDATLDALFKDKQFLAVLKERLAALKP